jgi:hypothetical protein
MNSYKQFDVDAAVKAIEEGQSYLLLPDAPEVTRRWDTVGLILAPEVKNGKVVNNNVNIFRLFLSGFSKPAVDGYIQYVGEKGPSGIRLSVEHLDAPPSDQKPVEVYPPQARDVLEKFQSSQKDTDFLFQDGDLNFAIQRLYIATKPPYRVVYTIDPTVFAQGVAQNETRDAAQFGGDYASVSCFANNGSVNMRLMELTYWGSWTNRGSRNNVGNGQQNLSNIPKNFTGQWQVEVTGQGAQNNFTLEYESIYDW